MELPRHVDARTLAADVALDAQVVVIGTGAGGAAVARELAEAGRDVVLLEEGQYFTARDYGHLSPLAATRMLYRDQGLTATQGAPPVLLPMGRCVGGTTVINLGTVLRMSRAHFAHWQAAGISRLRYEELEEAYARVEELMPVREVPQERLGPNTRMLIAGLQGLGIEGEVLPRNAPDCRGAGRCFLGCPTDAKRAVHLDWIPRAVERGARLYTGVRVDRIRVESGRAVGVAASILGPHETRRHTLTVRAPVVVLAAGALLSPLVLKASGIKTHAAAGGNLGVHPAVRAIGLYDRKIQGQYEVPQAYHAPVSTPGEMYMETAFLPPALMAPALPGFGPDHHQLVQQYEHYALSGFRIIETQRGRVARSFGGMPVIEYNLCDRDLATVRAGLKMACRMLFDTGAKRVFVPVHGMEYIESPADISKIDDPRISAGDLELSGYHVQGTLRMGADPAQAVVGEDGALHGTPGLYVADASLFPTSSRVNPQHTVMALGTRIARGIASPK